MSTSLSAGSTGDEIPHGEDIRNVPLHIDVPRESDRPVHGEDLSTLLAQPKDVPPTPGESAYTSSKGVYIGEGLPPVPAKLARKIRGGEFIEMDELLPEVWTMKKGGEPEPKRRCGRKVLDIFRWLQCFGIYVSIRGMQSPTSIPEFMAYMSMIVRINQEYAGMAWLNYDTLYRKHVALKKDTRWSVINTMIYARCVTGAPRNPVKCGVCASTTHDTQDCVEGLSSSMSIEQRMELMERQLTQLAPRPRAPIRHSGEVCKKWNREECSLPYFRHTHVCSICSGAHPATQCPRKGYHYVHNYTQGTYHRGGHQPRGPKAGWEGQSRELAWSNHSDRIITFVHVI